MICVRCEEEVLPGEESEVERPFHVECAVRAVIGSVGHLLGKCSCYGGTEEDPPGMTRRQAAKAALDLYRQQRQRGSALVKSNEGLEGLGWEVRVSEGAELALIQQRARQLLLDLEARDWTTNETFDVLQALMSALHHYRSDPAARAAQIEVVSQMLEEWKGRLA